MGKLDSKIAVITGAGQGVGRGIALAMAKEGAAVGVSDMNPETSIRTANEIEALGGRALSVACDVRQREQVQAAVAQTVKEFGTINILVNCAQGHRLGVLLQDTTDDDMALALESGLLGTFYFMQTCFPYLKEGGGKIINLGSAAGLEGSPRSAAYAAAKESIRGLTRVAAHEWGKYKINANVICPFANSPGMVEYGDDNPKVLSAMLMTTPLGRMGDCEEDIGRVAVFLASPDSDYITGHTINVDGGLVVLR